MTADIKKNFITISLSVLTILVLFSGGLALYNRSVMVNYTVIQKQTEEMRLRVSNVFETVLRKIDLGLRGYALTKNPQLLHPYNQAIHDNVINNRKIDSLLAVQGLDSVRVQFASFKLLLTDYVTYSEQMKQKVDSDSTLAGFVEMLNKDKGFDLWNAYSPIFYKIRKHQDNLMEKAQAEYKKALNRNVYIQCILVLLCLPTLIGVIIKLRRDARERKELLLEFEKNNRKYMFDPGNELPDDNPQAIIESSIQNLKKASTFIKDISGGNYAATWNGLSADNTNLNQDNLVGDLIKMRDQMKRVKQEDEKRLWATEGLAKFSDVARTNQDNIEKLSNEVVRFLSKYLNAQQASLFVLHGDDDEDSHLELLACYAFDKKKYVHKRVDLGSGLVGQAYKEGTTTVLTTLPPGYISITSGLGQATPTCLIIVPMKYNEQVEAILELASFKKFEQHEVQFLEKVGEVIASAIYSTKINERTTRLLQESQEQAETLKAQEEELRQNMEELQATQENMRRKQSEDNS